MPRKYKEDDIKYERSEKVKERKKQYVKNNKEKVKLNQRAWRLKNLFGIDEIKYKEMLEKQERKCAICEISSQKTKKSLAVDHNHTTGQIRGLLCLNCNMGLGKFMDNKILLEKAIEYLK